MSFPQLQCQNNTVGSSVMSSIQLLGLRKVCCMLTFRYLCTLNVTRSGWDWSSIGWNWYCHWSGSGSCPSAPSQASQLLLRVALYHFQWINWTSKCHCSAETPSNIINSLLPTMHERCQTPPLALEYLANMSPPPPPLATQRPIFRSANIASCPFLPSLTSQDETRGKRLFRSVEIRPRPQRYQWSAKRH